MADVTMVERVGEAIRNAVTRIDGDPVGVHLSYSIALDESNADETMAGIKSICEDAARAAIEAMFAPSLDMLETGAALAGSAAVAEVIYQGMIGTAIDAALAEGEGG